ncbi:cobalt-precorrin-6A reductase [Amycolatopsis regifaucium]|uniref:Cobalt-precorrin-6A reductase n=1 Tax=Amycolatopsis regifaucium TaxID=546365 RepID=A0A154M6I1_9PSEU|nr:cobalt-precorrin-6A reductase [Amycolatopsis regifaucium]KZB80225.1 cobalt-precorrin-6X reductase [Amycolatopsis regifaucium]OKA09679.1 cobalt-precorrin-6A reductase [Amycolatopsis regifaucium]SFH64358.1 precorrin-6A/cobalt-precorrin-6A reductase [Amycolatopsis regifaucium]
MTLLILGGTGEARELAKELVARGEHVVSSLAGRVARPKLPDGEVRVGGFGGPEGLARWLTENDVSAMIDATHPFAERIGANAAKAAQATNTPLLRLARPGWTEQPGDTWHWADDLDHAARLLPGLGERVFLTSGRQGLAAFAGLDDLWFLIRCVDPPEEPLPRRREVLLDRGPYTVEKERGLMERHGVQVLVTKDSGGAMTAAKLTAARGLGLPVVVVRRPRRPETASVTTVQDALIRLGVPSKGSPA